MKKFLTLFVWVLLAILGALSTENLSAQELTLKSFEHNKTDAAAKVHQKKDNNGDPCALLRVYVALEKVVFKPSLGIVGEPISERPSEYNLYVPKGTKSIKIYGEGYLPFSYTFDKELEGNNSYEMILEVPIIADYAQIVEQQNKILQNQSSTTPAAQEKRWKVGDYYNENGKEGVVFWVDETGKHGKIVSMIESGSGLPWASDKIERKRLIGASDEYDGAKNMAVVKQIPDWQLKYPAFKWCADLGEGWYLPAKEELLSIYRVKDSVNKTLKDRGGIELKWYWSSTEVNRLCAWRVSMYNGYAGYLSKSYNNYVRAVSAF